MKGSDNSKILPMHQPPSRATRFQVQRSSRHDPQAQMRWGARCWAQQRCDARCARGAPPSPVVVQPMTPGKSTTGSFTRRAMYVLHTQPGAGALPAPAGAPCARRMGPWAPNGQPCRSARQPCLTTKCAMVRAHKMNQAPSSHNNASKCRRIESLHARQSGRSPHLCIHKAAYACSRRPRNFPHRQLPRPWCSDDASSPRPPKSWAARRLQRTWAPSPGAASASCLTRQRHSSPLAPHLAPLTGPCQIG